MKSILSRINVRWQVMIIALTAFLVPLWIKGTITIQTDIEADVYRIFTSPVNIDFFGRSKFNLLSYLMIVLALQFVWYYILKKKIHIHVSIPLLFSLGFILSLFIATMLSEHKEVAMLGFSDRYEGFYTYSYYFLIMFFTGLFIRDDGDVRFILKVMAIGIIPVVAFGVLQMFDIFLMHEESLEKLWFIGTDSFFQHDIDRYQEHFKSIVKPGYDIVGATLMNPNYFSVYSAVILQLALGFYLKSKRRKGITIYYIVVCVAFVGAVISGSKTAFYIGMIMLVIQVVLHIIDKQMFIIKKTAILGVGLLVLFIGLNSYSKGEIAYELLNVPMTDEAEDKKSEVFEEKPVIGLEQLIMIDPSLIAEQQLESIQIQETKTIVKDGISEVELVIKQDSIVLGNEEELQMYSQWRLKDEGDYTTLFYKGKPLHFGIVQDQIWVYGPRGLTDQIGDVKTPIIDGHLFTYRGYTWSIVLDLVKEKPVFGYGPDLLTLYTPVDDLINRFNFTSGATSIAINPHNMYLQHLFNGGIVTFVMFIGLIVSIYIKALMLYIKRKERRQIIQLLFFPLTTFLIVGLLNDTIIGTGTILYILLGIGTYLVTQRKEDVSRV